MVYRGVIFFTILYGTIEESSGQLFYHINCDIGPLIKHITPHPTPIFLLRVIRFSNYFPVSRCFTKIASHFYAGHFRLLR